MRIALLTSSQHKAAEFSASLGAHGQRMTAIPFDKGDASLDQAKELLGRGYDFVIREQTRLLESHHGPEITEPPQDMAILINVSNMEVWHLDDEEVPDLKTYQTSMEGFIDRDLEKGGDDVFGWDDVFIPINGTESLHSLKQDGMKTSARQINIGSFLADHIHFATRLDMRFFPMKQDRTLEFNSKAFNFIMDNDLIRKGTEYHWLENTLRNVANSGIFFRSAASRKEKNYWLPGLNAGIPLTAKKDEIHEITFLFHDLMHFQLPDLIPDVDGDFEKQVYVMHRVMGEALTLVLADIIFIDNLAKAGVDYDFSKRLIYPLFRNMKSGNALADLKPIVRAMAHYAVLSDDSLLRELLMPGAGGLETLAAFKEKYGRFFSEDVRWTERNYEQFATHSKYIKRWLELVSAKTLASNDLVTVSRFLLAMNCGPNDSPETILDDIVDIVFKRVVTPNARLPTVISADLCISNAFRRYMIGQMSIFARFGRIFDMPPIRTKLTRKIASKGLLSAADIAGMKGLFETYVDALAKRQIIDPSDAITYKSMHPLFPPFYVFYDEKKVPMPAS